MSHHSTIAWNLLRQHLEALRHLKTEDQEDLSWTERDPYKDDVSRCLSKIEDELHNLQKELFRNLCIEWAQDHPNIPISSTTVIDHCLALHGPDWFDYSGIQHELHHLYLTNGAALAIEHLLTEARTLLPYSRDRSQTAHDICQGRTLHLKGYLDTFGHKSSESELDRSTRKGIVALWKLCMIAFELRDPITLTESASLRRAIQDKKVVQQRWICDLIEFQCYKNTRLDIHFLNPHRALRIAHILCDPNPDLTALVPPAVSDLDKVVPA